MSVKTNKRLVAGIGWVKPKDGYCWVNNYNGQVNRVRKKGPFPAWGSRNWDEESMAEASIDP